MDLLMDKDRRFFLIPLEVLEEGWGNVRGLLGTGGDNFPRHS